jgi:hypothetical protein
VRIDHEHRPVHERPRQPNQEVGAHRTRDRIHGDPARAEDLVQTGISVLALQLRDLLAPWRRQRQLLAGLTIATGSR